MKRFFAVAIILVIILAPGAVASADYGIVVTGHPSDSTCFSGDTAGFYAEARFYNTMDWIFVDPCGGEHSAAEFRSMFPSVTVEGEYTSCLTVGNQTTELNGWAVFCHFHSDIDNANTNWAFFHVL